MNETYLTVKEVAELKGCGERNIQLLIEQNRLSVIEVDGQSTGRGGLQYRIPLSTLDNKLQLKYKRLRRKRLADSLPESALAEPYFDVEALTASEREEISFWKQLLDEWHLYRETCGQRMWKADESFIQLTNIKHPQLNLNRRTLYRKWKALNEKSEYALIDRRGKHGNHSKKLTALVWDIFEAFYLDESRKSVSLCVTLTGLELEAQLREGAITKLPELPSICTFNKEVKKIPVPYIEYFRHGRMSFIGKCEPYIKRMYDNLEPNDICLCAGLTR